MARKAVLEGGKKDELIREALKLFLERGYDAVSIRTILKQVGGEVGMFYHYFKSKEEIFQAAVDYFLREYSESAGEIMQGINGSQSGVTALINLFTESLSQYKKLAHSDFHWSVRLALNVLTLDSIVPHAAGLLERLKTNRVIRPAADCSCRELAGYLIFGARGIMHEKPLLELTEDEINAKLQKIKEFTIQILQPTSILDTIRF